MRTFKNINDLKWRLLNDDQLKAEFQADPIKFMNNTKGHPYMDKKIFKNIVLFLGFLLVLSFAAAVVYIFYGPEDSEVPTFFVTICSTSLGALVGLLSPTPRGEDG